MHGRIAPWLCLWLVACAGHELDKPEVDVRVLAAGLQCGSTELTSIIDINSSKELSAFLPDRLPEKITAAIDRERVFVISMGRRPTTGYSLSLARPRARLDRTIATIALNWHAPEPGVFVAQMITNPCLVISLEKRSYAVLSIVDQNGTERARLVLKGT